MGKICRILSIICGLVVITAIVVFVVKDLNKPKDKKTYATDIGFLSSSGGLEMYIGNELIISNSMLKIEPSNCAFEPEFTIKKYGALKENDVLTERYTFTEKGRYTLSCKIKSSENDYITDKITIKVVDEPTEDTSMYLINSGFQGLKVDQSVNLNQIATIFGYDKISNVVCSNNILYDNGVITAVNPGDASVDVFMTSDYLTIASKIEFLVVDKVNFGDIKLELTMNGNVVQDNVLEIENSPFDCSIGYSIIGLDDQEIFCWTEDNIVQVCSYLQPEIILKPLLLGETTVYVRSMSNINIVFEILVRII